MSKELKSLDILDKELRKYETKFTKKLESYYAKMEKQAISQALRGKSVNIKDSYESGLYNLFKTYFRDINKIGVNTAKKDLEALSKTQADKEKLNQLNNKIDKNNIIYARKLAQKQITEYEENIKEKLNSSNNRLSKPELKDLIQQKSQAFKNTRLSATSETEANRVINSAKVAVYEDFGLAQVRFTAVKDTRTTQICLHRDGLILKIGSSDLAKNTPPLHVRCRSYLVPTNEKFTSKDSIQKVTRSNPLPPQLKIMPKG